MTRTTKELGGISGILLTDSNKIRRNLKYISKPIIFPTKANPIKY
jgi:hypothetical protein